MGASSQGAKWNPDCVALECASQNAGRADWGGHGTSPFNAHPSRPFASWYLRLRCAGAKVDRAIIAVVVSSINHCHCCLTAHGAAVRQLSGDPGSGEAITQNWRAAGRDDQRAVMLDFVVRLTERSDTIVEADRQALRNAGYTNRGIFDIAAVAAFFAMSNRVASATDMRPNDDYHAMAR